MKAHLAKFIFVESAHRNSRGGEAQQRLHGHSYKIELLAHGEVDPDLGWIVDYGDLKHLFQPLHDLLDHGYLNEIPGLKEDTSLAGFQRWLEQELQKRATPTPSWLAGVRVSIVGDLAFQPVHLPADPRDKLPERIYFNFEAAQSLPQLPQGHPCRNIHGHSYQVEVGADNLDTLTEDLAALYTRLDHRFLNEIEGLDHATCERICRWIWKWLAARDVNVNAVVVQETPSARCIYLGE